MPTLDWTALGRELRASAVAAHGDEPLPAVHDAYLFLLDNPECFLPGDDPEWPDDMPGEPHADLIAAYYDMPLPSVWCARCDAHHVTAELPDACPYSNVAVAP